MDETYINSDHHQKNSWSDNTDKGARVPVSKGPRIIVVHAGSEEGFVDDALLTYIPNKKADDYNDNMNYDNYLKYVEEKLILNLPGKSVFVIDNAPYHNKQVELAPTTAWRKDNIKDWLDNHDIQFDEKMLKMELLFLVTQHKHRFMKYRIDEISEAAGDSVLRLPPYHTYLNPIENIWDIVKQRVANAEIRLYNLEVGLLLSRY